MHRWLEGDFLAFDPGKLRSVVYSTVDMIAGYFPRGVLGAERSDIHGSSVSMPIEPIESKKQ